MIAPSAPNTVYATTKDHNQTDFAPTRLLKITDGGANWTVINLENFGITDYIRRLLVHPSKPNRLLLSTSKGAFVSNNGGLSWQKTLDISIYDLSLF